MRTVVRCLLALLVLSGPRAAFAQDERAFLDVVVNGVEKGSALVVLRDGDVLVGVRTLTESGLRGFAGVRETAEDIERVSLVSLAPHVTFVFDERELRLSITADPTLLGPVVTDLSSARPAGMVFRRTSSAFVNYALSARGRRSYDLFTESAVSAGPAVFFNTLSLTPSGASRGLTNLTFDDRRRLRRWTIGDAFGGTVALGGDAQVAGVAVGSEFALDPYFVRYPTFSMSTPVITPSTVEVHVNGRLVRQEQVQPGLLDLRQLPLTTGRNDTRIVVRDPFGAERELSTSYYLTTAGLAPGVHDYRYAFGWQRSFTGGSTFGYAAPTALVRHRLGVTEWLTAGGRLEWQPGFGAAGSIVNVRLPFGELEGAGGVSRASTGTVGTAGQLSFMYGARSGSVGAAVRQASRTFAALGAAAGSTPAREVSVSGSVPVVGGTSLNVQHAYVLGTAREQRTVISTSRSVARIAHLSTSISRSTGPTGRGLEATVGLSMTLGSEMSTSIYATRNRQGMAASVDLQRAVPVATGYGFQLRGEMGDSASTSGVVQYQGEHGRYELRRDIRAGGATSATVAGALVGIGGRVFATRPIRNSFALVRVPGVDGVRTYASHQEIGRTNGRGDLLIPNLLPYHANELNINDTDVPLDYVVPKVQETLAPPFRGGAVVLFPVTRIQRVSGRVALVTAAGVERPAFGELVVTAGGQRMPSPLGTSGEFYFENLAAGRHEATVRHEGRSCAFVLAVPDSTEPALDLGTFTCAIAASR